MCDTIKQTCKILKKYDSIFFNYAIPLNKIVKYNNKIVLNLVFHNSH